jgi:hypothetical protein
MLAIQKSVFITKHWLGCDDWINCPADVSLSPNHGTFKLLPITQLWDTTKYTHVLSYNSLVVYTKVYAVG